MNPKTGPYHIIELPPGRRIWVNTLDMTWPAHSMYGLLEVDVTVPRQLIAEHKARTGETLSFAGFLTFCLARAVDEDKTIQAYRKGDRQLVLFDDVNVGLMVERQIGEKRALMGHVIRAANARPTGRSTPRFARHSPNQCHLEEAWPPGSVLPCCCRGRYPGWLSLCSASTAAVIQPLPSQWEARSPLPRSVCSAGAIAAGG